MESTLVSARISSAKKEASASILKQIGATASDLINSAYDYLMETGELPRSNAEPATRCSDFDAFIAASTLDVDWTSDAVASSKDAAAGEYRQMLRDWKAADYESLA